MTTSDAPKLVPVLRIRFPAEGRLGHGKIELLEHIRRTGSISAAGRAMDMSYRRAWLLVNEMNAMFTATVVESQRGGEHGGGAVLTPFGEALVDRFRTMEQRLASTLGDDLAWLEQHWNRPDGA